ncbi:hypothetical protein [Aliiroseovarius sp. F47248L]|uniref:hypothetical protein n=1 Tax=Aliiroseovarius sp. F47248L TaxID=2926420 RepID=UPI001FF13580|nr:hypothetical protein [Aliiroseovarius sp. F47248L]MCK0137622.1 hypothetical protein [Aliiroseovarius sp. F47248L]
MWALSAWVGVSLLSVIVLIGLDWLTSAEIDWLLVKTLFLIVVAIPVLCVLAFWVMFSVLAPLMAWGTWHYFSFLAALVPVSPLRRLRDFIHRELLADTIWTITGQHGIAAKVRQSLLETDSRMIRD